jgi:homoserine dehydrogenase
MQEKKVALIGFGNVARVLARLLVEKQSVMQTQYGFSTRVVAIGTGHHGKAIDPQGIDVEQAIALVTSGQSLDSLSAQPAPESMLEFIRQSGADVLFENSPLDHTTGQPAIDHLRTGLERGMHAITANKGPVVHAYRELNDLAAKQGRCFLFESAVMDGAPIFSLFREPLPATEVRAFSGVLNSTTNMIFELMEQGQTFAEAVAQTQQMGMAETDPSNDIEGWDAAIKVAALSTVILGVPLTPAQVERTGIRDITPQMLREARAAGERWKLLCTARRDGDKVVTRVAPQRVGPDTPYYSINGTSSYVQFETDTLPGLGIVENNPSPRTTAYGLLADLVNAVRHD